MANHIEDFLYLLGSNSFTANTYEPSNLDETYDPSDWIFYEHDIEKQTWYSYDDLKVGIETGEIEGDIFTIFKLNGFDKPSDLEDNLLINFESFKEAFTINNYQNDKNVKNEIVNQIRSIRTKLEILLDYTVRIHNHLLNSLIKAKIEICADALRFINLSTIPESSKPVQKNIRTRRNLTHLTDLTQDQVTMLSHYMRKFGCFGKSMSNNLYASYVSELSGFSSEQIRKDLSYVTNLESYEFSESDYIAVRRIVKKIVEEIEQDCKKIYSSNF